MIFCILMGNPIIMLQLSRAKPGNPASIYIYILAEQQPVGRRVELKQEPVSPSSD